MPGFEIIREKLDQAVGVLEEKGIDLWITFVRETSHVGDPCLDLVLGLNLTWQSTLMISHTGEHIAIVGRFDADNVERWRAIRPSSATTNLSANHCWNI